MAGTASDGPDTNLRADLERVAARFDDAYFQMGLVMRRLDAVRAGASADAAELVALMSRARAFTTAAAIALEPPVGGTTRLTTAPGGPVVHDEDAPAGGEGAGAVVVETFLRTLDDGSRPRPALAPLREAAWPDDALPTAILLAAWVRDSILPVLDAELAAQVRERRTDPALPADLEEAARPYLQQWRDLPRHVAHDAEGAAIFRRHFLRRQLAELEGARWLAEHGGPPDQWPAPHTPLAVSRTIAARAAAIAGELGPRQLVVALRELPV